MSQGPLDQTLGGLYRGLVFEHSRSCRHRGAVDGATCSSEGKNPLCGDELRFALRLDASGRIEALGYEGHGCAISQASASMLAELLEGQERHEAERLLQLARDYLKGERTPLDADELGDYVALEGVSQFPVRIKCALLPVITAQAALEGLPSATPD